MVTTLFFDLDGVILHFKKAESYSLEKTFANHHIPLTKDTIALYHKINDGLWKAFEKGEVTKERVTDGRFNDLFTALGIEEDYVSFAHEYQDGIADGFFLYDDAYETLEKLSKKYRLYAVTNGVSTTAYKRLDGTNTRQFFKDVFVSEDLHAQKPSLEYFNQVIDLIGDFKAEETVLIGDSLTSDIQGAKNIGVRSVYLNRNHLVNTTSIIPDYEIYSLDELENLLNKL